MSWNNTLSARFGALGVALLALLIAMFGVDQYLLFLWPEKERTELGVDRLAAARIALYGAFLVVLALGVWVVLGVRRRVQALARTAERIAAGDLACRAAMNGTDEIAALGAAFDRMTGALRDSLHKETDEKTRVQAIIDSTADGILTMDEKGNLMSVNATGERLFGYRGAELVGRNVSALVPALYQEGQSYEDREVQAGEAKTIESESIVRGIRKDGSRFPLALRVTEMKYLGAKLFIATVQDITRRRQVEEGLASASAQILASTTEQAAGAEEQAAAVAQTVITVDQVTQTATQAAQRARGVGDNAQRNLEVGKAGRKAVEDSIAALNALKEQVENTADNILMLADQAQAIGEIIATVNDIAEQTNLLALNAAIEASRAGEHGKGFSVVAGEVKALADQSKKATAQVRQILGQIQKATNTVVLSTEDVTKGLAAAIKAATQTGENINTLAETLSATAQAAAQIVASANQQATGMNQIHQAMKNLDQVAKQNLAATRQLEQAAQNLTELGRSRDGGHGN
jgi:PAS domain S-box-containing protein